ncbi:hypothetical protein [Lactococcus lactis]|uniref:Uncharacterized protein n=1 Tax=Lactococcus lactis TaxID=1358 RepID=A0AAE4NMY0_9LACT|nr:hypothetical protein [Lactococcus lactis]MDV2631270.1 hypothetical protein [Lactococcus lactis]PAK66289.1 hypothetical protein B8W94_11335 [Lactococcus lactis]PEN17887.1 hypothetical protein CRM88_11880 [Lactococcus lactis]
MKNILKKLKSTNFFPVPPDKFIELVEKSVNPLLYLSLSMVSLPFLMFLLEFIVVKNSSTNGISKYLFDRGKVVFDGNASSLIIQVMVLSFIFGLYLLIFAILIYIRTKSENRKIGILNGFVLVIIIILTVGFFIFDNFRLNNIFSILTLWIVALWIIYNLIKIIVGLSQSLSKEKKIQLFLIPIITALVGYLLGK